MIVSVEGQPSPPNDFIVDYAELSRMVQPLIDRLDHQHLNCFIEYPSAENIARYIAHELSSFCRVAVIVKETEKTSAEFGFDSEDWVTLRREIEEFEDNDETIGCAALDKKIVAMADGADPAAEIKRLEDAALEHLHDFEDLWNHKVTLERAMTGVPATPGEIEDNDEDADEEEG